MFYPNSLPGFWAAYTYLPHFLACVYTIKAGGLPAAWTKHLIFETATQKHGPLNILNKLLFAALMQIWYIL